MALEAKSTPFSWQREARCADLNGSKELKDLRGDVSPTGLCHLPSEL